MQGRNTTNDTGRRIAEELSKLFLHYWSAQDPIELRKSQMADWIEDLAEFGPEAVRAACIRWRRSQQRRPTPAELRVYASEEGQRVLAEAGDRARGKKPYAQMDEIERRRWHAGVYAFRKLILGIDEQTSPCDPEGRMWDADLVAEAEVALAKRKGLHLDWNAAERRSREDQLAGREIVNRWARDRGHADLDAYCAATGRDWIDVYRQITVEILAGGNNSLSRAAAKALSAPA